MNVTILNAYEDGGAGTATKRIHRSLRQIGVDSTMLVDHKDSDDPTIEGPEGAVGTAWAMARPFIDRVPLRFYRGSEGVFSPGWLPDSLPKRVKAHDPDVLHFNWMGGGFLEVGSLGDIDEPIVWRLPDMWAFTGGCHYAGDCNGYQNACGKCPKLDSDRKRDLSRLTWWRKNRNWNDAEITVVTPSNWLAECAAESSLFNDRRIEVIPNALDTDVFRPWSRSLARQLFGLPEDTSIVLFGAVNATSDPRKGFDLLQDALVESAEERGELGDVELVVFGSSEPAEPPELGYDARYTGYLNDDRTLALLYAAADVMVVPSRYEGFGQTASEALACGTPVVAFDATGPSDIVDHRENGYLAEPYDSSDLAEGIHYVLEDEDRRCSLSDVAREKAVRTYEMETVAQQYLDVYRSVT